MNRNSSYSIFQAAPLVITDMAYKTGVALSCEQGDTAAVNGMAVASRYEQDWPGKVNI